MAKFCPTSVTHVLKKAGIDKSEFHRSGMVRGWGSSTQGFRISAEYGEKQVQKRSRPRRGQDAQWYSGTVADTSKVLAMTVEWVFGDWFPKNDAALRDTTRNERFAQMTAALTKAGYTVESVAKPVPFGGTHFFLRLGMAQNLPETPAVEGIV